VFDVPEVSQKAWEDRNRARTSPKKKVTSPESIMKSEATKTTAKTYSGSVKKRSYYAARSDKVKRPSLFPFDRYIEAAINIQRVARGYIYRSKFSDFRTLRAVPYSY
jgi:hypothetical protein